MALYKCVYYYYYYYYYRQFVQEYNITILECGPMPNVMAALSNTGGALCSTSQSLADAHY